MSFEIYCIFLSHVEFNAREISINIKNICKYVN